MNSFENTHSGLDVHNVAAKSLADLLTDENLSLDEYLISAVNLVSSLDRSIDTSSAVLSTVNEELLELHFNVATSENVPSGFVVIDWSQLIVNMNEKLPVLFFQDLANILERSRILNSLSDPMIEQVGTTYSEDLDRLEQSNLLQSGIAIRNVLAEVINAPVDSRTGIIERLEGAGLSIDSETLFGMIDDKELTDVIVTLERQLSDNLSLVIGGAYGRWQDQTSENLSEYDLHTELNLGLFFGFDNARLGTTVASDLSVSVSVEYVKEIESGSVLSFSLSNREYLNGERYVAGNLDFRF
jgi:hypothetical protein